MTAVWASPHKELCSDGGMVLHGFAPLVSPDCGVVLDRCHLLGAAVDANREAATEARRAERSTNGGVVDVPQILDVSPRAPRINAQRVARYGHCCIRKCLLAKGIHRSIQ